MAESTSSGVAGSVDNVAPLYDPNRGFRIWALSELFDGQFGEGRYVPNINDRALDQDTEVYYKIVSLDPTTLIPTLVKATPNVPDGVFSQEDVLLGVGPGPQTNTYRAFLNDKVIPHEIAIDQRCYIAGSRAKYARLYRGGIYNSDSRVVSAVYDTAGNLVGQDIPLELSKIQGNVTWRSVTPCKCTEKIPNGETVYVVFFSDTNQVISKQQLLVENTNFLAGPNTGVRYIKDISLESPFLSETDATLLQYPLNVLQQSLNLIGVVTYSDNTTARYPIDGTKFSLWGLEDYIVTVVGDEIKLVLNYSLAPDEIAIGNTLGENRNIVKEYRAKTLVANGSYSVKLFAYPVWTGALNGYRLEWFLANLERTNIWRCTQNVRIDEAGRQFMSAEYNTNQRLTVSVDLQSVNASFHQYKHVQTIDVTLLRPGTDDDTNWQIGFEPSQNPPFGVQNYAVSTFVDTNNWKVQVDMAAADQTEWLDRLFYRTLPLYDSKKETKAPLPTHFAFDFTNRSIEFPISEWKNLHTISEAVPDGATLFVRFFKRTGDNDIQLGISGVPVRQTN